MNEIPSHIIRKKNILFLTSRFPYPLIGGDRIKSYYLLHYLAKHSNVTLITFSHSTLPKSEYIKALQDLGIEVHIIVLNPVLAALTCIRTVFSKFPLEILFYLNAAFKNKVLEIIQSKHIDIGFAFFMRTAEYLRNLPLKKVLIAEDCRTLYQTRSAEASGNLLQKIVRLWEVYRLSIYEPSTVADFDVITLVTQADIQAMRQSNPNAHYALLSNGIDLEIMKPSDEQQLAERSGLIFAGKLDLWANTMMINTIVKEILPIVLSQESSIKLTIVGADPLPELLKLNSNSIRICANVHSIEEYLYQAAIFVHPHKGASGIQNKVLQAMACGCVVITTSTGIQGIPAIHGEHVLIGNSSEEIASLIMYILLHPKKRIEIALYARKLIEEQFSWQAIYQQMDNVLNECDFSFKDTV